MAMTWDQGWVVYVTTARLVRATVFGRRMLVDSRMWCPHDIGRDSWVWGEQGTLRSINSPPEWGEEALTERIPLSVGNGVALG